MVFNVDPSDLPGRHWLALYSPAQDPTVECLDSYGTPDVSRYDAPEARAIAHRVCPVTAPRLQSDETYVCGHYCLAYLYARTHGKTPRRFVETFSPTEHATNDRTVCRFVCSVMIPRALRPAFREAIHVPCDHWEIVSIQVELIEELGKGAFGKVWKASMERKVVDETTKPVTEARQKKDNQALLLNNEDDLMIVAVKMLHSDATLEEKHEFLREIEFMKNVGCHRNIISMIACCTKEEHLFLVVEFAKHGDLLNLLRERRKKIRCPEYEDQELSNEDEDVKQHNENLLNDLISISWQIATGMEYLATKGIVHRDLAARNILVAEDNLVKVADFGLSRHVTYKDQCYKSDGNQKLPIKWMSPEAILDKTFTTKSDVDSEFYYPERDKENENATTTTTRNDDNISQDIQEFIEDQRPETTKKKNRL
ncbi:hypothetical protein QZH41_000332 [Actinostola sp. cb2023]|nr:hypothetical protein QZH41_000332 [Actinostola sp. cb2023]